MNAPKLVADPNYSTRKLRTRTRMHEKDEERK